MTIARFDGRCIDRCGLPIHAGHDAVERGHFGWRHVDCDQALARAWVRERLAAGDSVSDVQIKLLTDARITPAQRTDASLYALDYQGAPG